MTTRLREWLVLAYGVLWGALAISPVDRADWALENLLVLVFAAFLYGTGRWRTLTTGAFVCVLVFLCLHAVGAHYTYSLVPYDRWAEALTGASVSDRLGLDRNHYDRLVHFAYGLLLTGAIREVLPHDRLGPGWRLTLPVAIVLSLSAASEIVEWAAAMLFGGDLGIAYVGAQGDPWDAQKDMVLAVAGALLSTALGRLPALAAHMRPS